MYPRIPGDPWSTVWEPLLYMYGFDLGENRSLMVAKRKRMEIYTIRKLVFYACEGTKCFQYQNSTFGLKGG